MSNDKNPFYLPEILGLIFNYTHGLGTLCVYAQVNRVWAKEAVNLIWATDIKEQGIAALTAVEDVERRQYYANKIRSLTFPYVDCFHYQLEKILFPRLQHVALGISGGHGFYSGFDERRYLQYLQPALQSIELYSPTSINGRLKEEKLSLWGVSPSTQFLHEIQIRCPGLRNITMELPHDARAVLQLLGALPAVERMVFNPNREDSFPWLEKAEHPGYTQIFQALAKLPHLNYLSWPTLVSKSRVRILQKNDYKLFPMLRKLQTRGVPDTLRTLSYHLQDLEELEGILGTGDRYDITDIVAAIAEYQNLRKLDFPFFPADEMKSSDLLHISSKCPKLEVLKLAGGANFSMSIRHPAVMTLIASSLPKLRILDIKVNLRFDAANLRSFALCCPDLEECTVEQFDLLSLSTEETPLFPRLRKLRLNEVMNVDHPDYQSAPAYIKIIKHHMPGLKHFHFFRGYDLDLENAILKGLSEWIKSKGGRSCYNVWFPDSNLESDEE